MCSPMGAEPVSKFQTGQQWNKSGHDDKEGRAGGRRHRPILPPTVGAEPPNG